jgi:hypothetical protein
MAYTWLCGAVAIAVAVLPSSARADSFSRGSISAESRGFVPDDSDDTEDAGIALVTRLEIKYRPSTRVDLVLRGLARFDALDDTRNIGTLEDAYIGYAIGRLRLRLGTQILNWTATEAFHPNDIMNSRNYDSDFENLEKLGEPMVEAQVRVLQGSLSVYYMPIRITPNLVSTSSRLSLFPEGFKLGDTQWVGRDGQLSESLFAHQGAVHFSQTIGRADVAIHVVDHNDRQQPKFEPIPSGAELRPTYHWVTQFGVSYVQVFGSLLLKVEAAHRQFHEPAPSLIIDSQTTHQTIAAGLEYGWTTDAGHDATVLAEGQAVLVKDRAVARDLDLFQGDVLIGYRHAFNDEKSRELLLVFIADAERPYEYVAALRYAQALSDTWSVAATARSFRLLDKKIHFAEFSLTRNF